MFTPMQVMTGQQNRYQKLLTLRGLTHRASEENQAENTPNYYTTYYTICP